MHPHESSVPQILGTRDMKVEHYTGDDLEAHINEVRSTTYGLVHIQ